MTRKKRNLLFVGLIAILGIVFLSMTKFNSRWRIKQAVKKEERTREVWKEAPFIGLTDHQKVSEAIDSIMLRGTNIHLINPKQTKALKMQIQNCLEAYSQGDFNKFVEFRMPCGQGINTVVLIRLKWLRIISLPQKRFRGYLRKFKRERQFTSRSLENLTTILRLRQ